MGRSTVTMDRATQTAMRELGWTWSPGAQHFHKTDQTKHRLISDHGRGWFGETYDAYWSVESFWRDDERFDTPFAALAHAEIEQWGAQ